MMNTPPFRRFALIAAVTLALPLARFEGRAQTAGASKTKAHVVALASDRLGGGLTRSPREAAGGRLSRSRARADRREADTRTHRLPAPVRIHCGNARRRIPDYRGTRLQ